MDPLSLLIGVSSVVVGLLAILVALRIRSRKRLSYGIVSSFSMFNVAETAKNDLEIRFRGVIVRDVQVIEFRIWNSGNSPILPTDFHSGIKITFKGQMLESQTIGTQPPNLQVEGGGWGSPDNSGIEINPLLLNPKDSITYRIAMTDFRSEVSVETRIAGAIVVGSIYKPVVTFRLIVTLASSSVVLGLSALAIVYLPDSVLRPLILGMAVATFSQPFVYAFLWPVILERTKKMTKFFPMKNK